MLHLILEGFLDLLFQYLVGVKLFYRFLCWGGDVFVNFIGGDSLLQLIPQMMSNICWGEVVLPLSLLGGKYL